MICAFRDSIRAITNIIGYALVKALMAHPDLNNHYDVINGKPTVITPEHINLGLAIDLPQKDGTRALVMAAIKECETLDFKQFVEKYEDIVRRSRKNQLCFWDELGRGSDDDQHAVFAAS